MSAKGTKRRKPDDEQESKRFVETAKTLESDETGDPFERAVGVIVGTRRDSRRGAEKPPK
ncbi:hypothetical protein [Sinimarinibacterium flocculans]|uniref:hypothetical protein n=1 Tax=Sinimarinibacterium flocculans TaxID=985250 RepID=UPI003511581B